MEIVLKFLLIVLGVMVISFFVKLLIIAIKDIIWRKRMNKIVKKISKDKEKAKQCPDLIE